MSGRRKQLNTSTMSFLDIVCAGFASAIFMFIVFASLPISPAGGMLGSTEYLDIEMEWKNNPSIRMELVLTLPSNHQVAIGQNEPGLASNFTVDPIMGQLLSGPTRASAFRSGWGAAYLAGSAPHKESDLRTDDTQKIRLRLLDPCEGLWKISINQNNTLGELQESSKDVEVKLKAFTAMQTGDSALTSIPDLKFNANTQWTKMLNGEQANPYMIVEWVDGGADGNAPKSGIEVNKPTVPAPQAHCS